MTEERQPLSDDGFKYALNQINDGFVFENFALRFLPLILGYEFMPVGGVKDKGIDGLNYIYSRAGFEKNIFQLSTETNTEGKIENSLQKLIDNEIPFDSFVYVTNRAVNNKDTVIDKFVDKFKKPIRIFDQGWFVTHANHSDATINCYYTFIDSYLHEFNKPGKSYVISNLAGKSELFVFLRQQLEHHRDDLKIDDLLADTLILFGLEGTDPDKDILKTKEELIVSIKEFVKFDPRILSETIDRRLKALSTKPRRIKFHSAKQGYCLPYETRVEIQNRNLADAQLLETFYEQTSEIIKKYLKEESVAVRDLTKLIDEVIHSIFYQQGLEFSNYILHGKSQQVIEKDLQDIINSVVDSSSVVDKNKEKVKTAMLMAIRDIVYNGTIEQKKYFKSLSNTYMMMFLLQWNPQIATYFEAMASKLVIYVCTSILVPALSEYYLTNENKRHWNLLKGASQAGIRLYISDAIIDELMHHFYMLRNKYETFFRNNEQVYLNSEAETMYIDEIMLRAYFYAKSQGKVFNFEDFLSNFVDPDLKTVKDDLISYLKCEFGIVYFNDESLKIKISEEEQVKLTNRLIENKSQKKAETDSKIILSIYKLREKNNETATSGIFGYKTWWLSKDSTTFKAVTDVFGDKYPVSCYIRPDFLYNYITLAPKKHEVDEMYKEVFPSLLGVNLSFHLPSEVTDFVQERIVEHGTKHPARLTAILARLSEKLKSDPNLRNRKSVKSFWDEEQKRLEESGM
ncbi:MAG: hypothetical protein N3F62_05185 [Bacteroidia bacterium]|nr:hypothetical protein [Bacteroidia bacterium]